MSIIVMELADSISIKAADSALDYGAFLLPLADGRVLALGHYAPGCFVELPADGYDVVAICYPASARRLGHPALGDWDEITYCEAVLCSSGSVAIALYPASESYTLPNGKISHHALD